MAEKKFIKIGTRGSDLALWQARWVKRSLEKRWPSLHVELIPIKTKGDKILDVPLAKVGGKGLFVKEIEAAIIEEKVDLAVHSMKDMPSEIPDGLCIGAIPKRENPSDVIVSRNDLPLDALPGGARVGTSSLRRGAQIKNLRPDIEIVPLRGNLDTRLKKLETEGLDAVVLAAAGILRLELAHRISQYLDTSVFLPAVGQGALCIEVRENDPEIRRIVEVLDHAHTRKVVSGERAFLHRLEGGCQVPIAAHGTLENGTFHLAGLVAEVDGSAVIKNHLSGPETACEKIGLALAEELLRSGAKEILRKLIEENEE